MIESEKILKDTIYKILEGIPDPEIPVLSILDLGIVREVVVDKDKTTVKITPTYTGCPAMDWIRAEIEITLKKDGVQNPEVITVIHPPWTTDWLTKEGKKKLEEYGIAPPGALSGHQAALYGEDRPLKCPHCGSQSTSLLSQFGSTPCKSLYRCDDCSEPFDYFKCH